MKQVRIHLLSATLISSLTALGHPGLADAQGVDSLAPQVRKYVSVSAPKVILEHVQIIDGTGAAPNPDQNIYIAGGKITATSAGTDHSPSDDTTILDLRGYTVMPGMVGMHSTM